MPNSTARRNARASKPRHKQPRSTDAHHNPRHNTTTDRRHHPRRADGDRGDSWDRGPDHRDNRQDAWQDKRDRHATRGHRRDDRWREDRHTARPHARDRRSTGHDGDRGTATRRDGTRREAPGASNRRERYSGVDHRDTGATGWSGTRGPRATARRRGGSAGGRPTGKAHGAHVRRDARSAVEHSEPRLQRHDSAVHPWDGEIAETAGHHPTVTFAELGLPTPLLKALGEAGIAEPFPIQAATLPDALSGRDVLGRAQTGSGKTLAFGLALLTRLHKGKSRPGHPRGLVLVPTRELAMQVADALLPLAKSLGLWCRTVVGGLSFSRQTDQLQRGIDLLIATPGRLSDHVRQGTCVLDDVRFVALDEADQMADMGFLPQVRAILDLVPDGQRMLFSATLDRDVAALVDRYLTDPVTHSVSPPTATVSTMDHHLLLVSREDKPAVVAEMAAREGRTIMFLRTKHHVDRLTRQLRAVGVRAGALHGGKPQGARNRVLGEFKDGRLPVLIATDVAARGIHVDGVSLVVHVDPPADAKGYLHRAGRTARAGEAGTVVTLVTHQERRTVFRMTEQAGVEPERTTVRPGDDDLVRITGARTPTGEPVIDTEPARRPGGRFSRPAGRHGARPRRR